ncbi:MAG: hypothetical protein J6X60_02910 [Ruminiclostridium sp.]|nr:hypothetical protein [Ruminiclostridium sp.]
MSPLKNTAFTTSAPRNFDFVSFPKEVNTQYITDINNRKGEFSGTIQLEMTAVDNIYCGSGNVGFDKNDGLTTSTLIEGEKCIIPGSSIKGAVRQVARAISDGCIKGTEKGLYIKKEQRYECNLKDPKKNRYVDNICIICDMFGMMSLSSKIAVSDFVSEKYELVKCDMPDLFTPNINSSYYKEDNVHLGYKFYYTRCDDRSSLPHNNVVYAVKKGTVFEGEVRFKYLDKKELNLLMYSLGIIKDDFSHKIGGYRADGFGTVNFFCKGFVLNSEMKSPKDALHFAGEYPDNASDECYYRIEKLCEIMKYKG